MYESYWLFKWCIRVVSWESFIMMKLVWIYVLEIINDVLNKGVYSNLKINEVLFINNINIVDKNLFIELVYGIIKRKYMLDYLLKFFIKIKIKLWVW